MHAYDPIIIGNPIDDLRNNPFLVFQLHKFDNGELDTAVSQVRTDSPNYKNRTPYCVTWHSNYIELRLTNFGHVASDLVKIDYEFRLCTAEHHRPEDGFAFEHFDEQEGSTSSDIRNIKYVPARGDVTIKVMIPDLNDAHYNLYFRARASRLRSASRPKNSWSFATDCLVIEAHKRLK